MANIQQRNSQAFHLVCIHTYQKMKVLFCSITEAISTFHFKNKENGWIVPIKFDGAINTSDFAETCPSLSPDEKYIFYSRYNDLNDKSDIVG